MTNIFRNRYVIFLALVALSALTVHTAHAAPKFIPLADPGTGRLANLYTGNLSDFINGLFKFAIALGAIIAVLRIAYAGYLYMGSDLWSKKGRAREILGDVTLGLLLLLSIYLILFQINPDIVSLTALKNIKPPASSGSPSSSGPSSASVNPTIPVDQQAAQGLSNFQQPGVVAP